MDGGFTCPNRDADPRRGGGCSYCSSEGSRAPYLPPDALSLSSQVEAGISFLVRRYDARLFFLYFQAFSSTYAPIDVLRERYDEAFSAARRCLVDRFGDDGGTRLRGLVVSTRPDCIDEARADLISSYGARAAELWVELGLQSAKDETLRAIGRGHDFAAFERAVFLLHERGLRVAAHVILGLPGENRDDMLATIQAISRLGIEGIKFHDLRILAGTRLDREYRTGEITLVHPSRLPKLLADCIENLNPECEVMRLCTDVSAAATIAPSRPLGKDALYRAVEEELRSRGTRQGSGVRDGPPY